jgi:hypothetical protein
MMLRGVESEYSSPARPRSVGSRLKDSQLTRVDLTPEKNGIMQTLNSLS